MKVAGFDTHPAAERFPLMSDADLQRLAVDIQTNGLIHPVVLHEGKVLDGRNRLLACEIAQVKPRTVDWEPLWAKAITGGKTEIESRTPTGYVMAANLERRNLTPSQRAMLALELLPMFEAEAKERQREGARKGGQSKGKVSEPVREASKPAAADAAAAAKTSSRYVEAAKRVKQASPELADRVTAGEVTLKQAEKQIRHAAQVEKVRAYVPPTGEYAVIVADPPWPYDDTLDGSDAARGGLPYPPMAMGEICELEIPAAPDCALWLWVTNTHLIEGKASEVLRQWGFTPKAMLTWAKPSIGAGRWLRGQTEHCILAVRGAPTVTLTNQSTLLGAPRGEHSEKPAEFYALVKSLCPSPSRLEMFARKPRSGWVTAGAELPENTATKRQRIQEGIDAPGAPKDTRLCDEGSCQAEKAHPGARGCCPGHCRCLKCAEARGRAAVADLEANRKPKRRPRIIEVAEGETEAEAEKRQGEG